METVKQEDLVHIDLWALVRKVMPVLRRYWALALALAVLLGGMMCIRSVGSYVPMYRSEAMFSVSLNTTGETDITSYSYYYDNAAAKQLVDTFPYILDTQLTRELICQKLGTSYINGSITSRSMADTNCFVLTVTSNNAQDAYDILQAVMEVYPQVSRQVIGETQLSVSREPALAEAPYNSVSWKRPLVMGAALGAALGLGLIVLAGLLRRTVFQPEDVNKLVNLSCLARIPVVQRKARKSGNEAPLLITQLESDSAFCEAHRLLRLKLLRQLKEEDKILMVTSSVPSEGKSTLSANLALLLSRDGKKVLLIDGDLRGPSVKDMLGITKSSAGMDAYLTDPELPMKFLRYGQSKLYVLAGDEPIPSPTALLQRQALEQFFQPLRDMFDYIIVDTPPCTTMADASAMCVHVDRVIYVIREDHAAGGQIYDGIQSLSDAGADICGFVFTQSTAGASGSGYGYGYGYGYGHGYGYSRYGKSYGYGKSRRAVENDSDQQ